MQLYSLTNTHFLYSIEHHQLNISSFFLFTGQMIASILFPHLPTEVCREIESFLYWDKTSLAYAQHRAKHDTLRDIHFQLVNGYSRKNGFHSQEKEDTENPHWAFSSEDWSVVLQAINCHVCGHYIHSHVDTLPETLLCHCAM